jgi:hypothetical protein
MFPLLEMQAGEGLCVVCPTPVAKNVSTLRALTERIKMRDQLSELANDDRTGTAGKSRAICRHFKTAAGGLLTAPQAISANGGSPSTRS